jgi:hypothetical protein
MGADRLRIATDEQRQWLHIGKERGGICAGCGRALTPGEPVYIERVDVERKPLTASGAGWAQRATRRDAPLGVECASASFLEATRDHPPEACGGCGRPVYHEVGRWGRRWVFCSKRCRGRRTGMEH